MNKLLKIAIMFAIPLAMWFITPPEGLSVGAWRLLGFYLMAIVGLVVKPWPAPIILLLSIAGSAIFLNATSAEGTEADGSCASLTVGGG